MRMKNIQTMSSYKHVFLYFVYFLQCIILVKAFHFSVKIVISVFKLLSCHCGIEP